MKPKYVYIAIGDFVEKISTYNRLLRRINGNAYYLQSRDRSHSFVCFSSPKAAKDFFNERYFPLK